MDIASVIIFSGYGLKCEPLTVNVANVSATACYSYANVFCDVLLKFNSGPILEVV